MTEARPRGLGFRDRIVLACIALLVGALLAVLLIVYFATGRSVRAELDQRMQVSERVWSQLLAVNANRLKESVALLARDFAFREAVATGDEATTRSALLNHGGRIRADVAWILEPDGRVRSGIDVRDQPAAEAAFAQLLSRAGPDGQVADILVLDNEPYLVAIVPVLAPRRVAWVAMGLHYGDAFARQYQALVGLDVALVEQRGDSATLRATTLSDAPRAALAASPASARRDSGELSLDGHGYALRGFDVAPLPRGALRALLLADLDEALRPSRELLRQIVLLSAVAAAVALGLAVMVGRGISQPVTRLADAARRVGRGEYADMPVHGRDELADLAHAFNAMQSGIAAREAKINHQANHDALTDLPNRAFALRHLEAVIDAAQASGGSLAVLMLDLNRFKEVNDTLGHAFGDSVLRVVAQRLRSVVRDADVLARLGGDEFLVVLEGAGEDVAVERARTLVGSLDAPFALGSAQISLDASIGIAVCPAHAGDAATLLRRADIAMYEAKTDHARVAVYRSGRDEHHLRQVALMGDLKFAREHGQLSVAFQPKIDLRTRRVAHVEALLRWDHPQFGKVGPDEFIPLAERSGVITALTRYVIDEALRVAGGWMRLGLIDGVAVNLSPVDLLDAALAGYVRDRLHAHGVAGDCLVLEVTESTAMHDLTASMTTMHAMRATGIRLSIDDFGTGHSSLAKLHSLPVNEIKIDKSFIAALSGDLRDDVIVRSAIEIAHNMGLIVIAEGVEDERSLAVLRALDCDMVQGYLFSAPLAPDDFPDWHAGFTQREAVA